MNAFNAASVFLSQEEGDADPSEIAKWVKGRARVSRVARPRGRLRALSSSWYILNTRRYFIYDFSQFWQFWDRKRGSGANMRAKCQPRTREGRAAGFRIVQSYRERRLRQGLPSTQSNRKWQWHDLCYEGTEICLHTIIPEYHACKKKKKSALMSKELQ